MKQKKEISGAERIKWLVVQLCSIFSRCSYGWILVVVPLFGVQMTHANATTKKLASVFGYHVNVEAHYPRSNLDL